MAKPPLCSLGVGIGDRHPFTVLILAGQGYQKLVMALIAEDAREARFVKSAIEIPIHDVIDKPSPEPADPLEALLPQPFYLLVVGLDKAI